MQELNLTQEKMHNVFKSFESKINAALDAVGDDYSNDDEFAAKFKEELKNQKDKINHQ